MLMMVLNAFANPFFWLMVLYLSARKFEEGTPSQGQLKTPRPQKKSEKRVFRLHDLPIEVEREIVLRAACSSPTTYRALLLTCRSMKYFCRIEETIPYLPITLHQQHQLESFYTTLTNSPQLASHVRHLWLFSDREFCRDRRPTARLANEILLLCPNIYSVACNLRNWTMRYSIFQPRWLTSVKDLTILEGFPTHGNFARSLDSLHVMLGSGGPRNANMFTFKNIPRIDSLSQVSFSVGSAKKIQTHQLNQLFQSGRLTRVAFLTRLSGPQSRKDLVQLIEQTTAQLGDRCTFRTCPRRLGEMKLWAERVRDKDTMWKLSKVPIDNDIPS
ncbi:hypothetical protein L218DRAFT_955166 [Marasmius fiardii PR-910]|nr:hypothetical protein L218DRAFT_955166 [Marasmius fiardii PR-910]